MHVTVSVALYCNLLALRYNWSVHTDVYGLLVDAAVIGLQTESTDSFSASVLGMKNKSKPAFVLLWDVDATC